MIKNVFPNFPRIAFWKETKIRFLIITSLILNIFAWLYIIFNFFGIKEFVILHYNIFFGIDAIGSWTRLFVPILFGFSVLMVNLILVSYFYTRQERKIVFVLLNTCLIVQIILLLFILLITGFKLC